MSSLTFIVPGSPQGKQRPKIVKIGGFSRMATPKKTVSYEGLVAHTAQTAMAGRALFAGAVAAELYVACQIPASWSGKRHRMALVGEIYPTTKPDVDNVVKAIFDGMNGVVFADDVQVVECHVRKRYASTPLVQVSVWTVGEQPVQGALEIAPMPAQQHLAAQEIF